VELGSLDHVKNPTMVEILDRMPMFLAHGANHLGTVQIEWLAHRLGLSTQALREDRILHEVRATGGDIRHLCGLSVSSAERHIAVLGDPDINRPDANAQLAAQTGQAEPEQQTIPSHSGISLVRSEA
jgi:hypothetical protein